MSQSKKPARALTLPELIERTTVVAEEVRRGLHEVHADERDRWHVRLHCDDQVDVWLISWTTQQGTQLHDHGGSAGAFTVVTGRLTESVWAHGRPDAPGHLDDHTRLSGDTVVFGPHYVHDVRNTHAETAVSVHAYSPPLSRMAFYDHEDGELVQLAEMWTEDPEAVPDHLADAS